MSSIGCGEDVKRAEEKTNLNMKSVNKANTESSVKTSNEFDHYMIDTQNAQVEWWNPLEKRGRVRWKKVCPLGHPQSITHGSEISLQSTLITAGTCQIKDCLYWGKSFPIKLKRIRIGEQNRLRR